MIIVTTNEVPGYAIEAVLGEVMGMTVRSANFGANFSASFRAIGGGEVTEYTQLVYESRNEVMNRMWAEAQRRGATAIIGMRFDTGDIGQAFTEICAYGTAVVVRPLGRDEPGATPQSIQQAEQRIDRPVGSPRGGPQPGGPRFGGPQPAGPQPGGNQPGGPQPGARPVMPQPPAGAPQQQPAPPATGSWIPQPPSGQQQSHQEQQPHQEAGPWEPALGAAAPNPATEPLPRPGTHGYSPQIPPPQDRQDGRPPQPPQE